MWCFTGFLVNSNLFPALNLSYADYGSRVTVNIVGPFRETVNVSKTHMKIDVVNSNQQQMFEINPIPDETHTLTFDIQPEPKQALNLSLFISTISKETIAFKLFVDTHSVDAEVGVIAAGTILIFLNILIGTEIVHRTVAAIFTAFTSIGVLATLNDRPSMSDIVTWIDCETLLLIFSMMVLVAILTDTGFFEYIAIYTYQV